MSDNIFFKKKNNFTISQLFNNDNFENNREVNNIKVLSEAKENDISFFDSINYKDFAMSTDAGFCLTTHKLKKYLPKKCISIVVSNVLYELAKVTKRLYPDADIDLPDLTLNSPNLSGNQTVKFGNNVLVGKNVTLGENTIIGSNTIIEHDVVIGVNCIIGSQVMIKNSLISNNVVIQDGCKIGQKGFGFIPLEKKNFKFPHIGKVIIKDDVEIGSSCTIDRGSIDDTIIEKNTYLDNQVHIGHNVKIGKNCMIAGQVGFAGSSQIGNNVSIGGQAGISGHLKIGNNVKIGGGSGVIKNIKDNSIVMGYPAVALRKFLKANK